MSTNDDVLAELRTQTSWLRLLGLQTLRPALDDLLKSDKQKVAYEFSDGSRTTRQVAEMAGIGAGTVSRWWTEWLAIGVCMEAPSHPGRAKHLASISDLGIPTPGKGPAVKGMEEAAE
jgi:hypothetical protein